MNSNSNKWRLVLISVTPAILIWFSTGLVADIGDDTAAMWIRRALESTVMTLQVGGLRALIASNSPPLARVQALTIGEPSLGVAGSVCWPSTARSLRRPPGQLRRFSQTLNLPIPHPVSAADQPVFPVFLAFERHGMGAN